MQISHNFKAKIDHKKTFNKIPKFLKILPIWCPLHVEKMEEAKRTRFSRQKRFHHYYTAWYAMKRNSNFKRFQENLVPNESESDLISGEAGQGKFKKNNQFCEIMLPTEGDNESVTSRLGLDILERCWERILENNFGNILRKLLREVASVEDIQRLKDWKEKIETSRGQGKSETGGFERDHQQDALDLLAKLQTAIEARRDCAPVLAETFGKVFK